MEIRSWLWCFDCFSTHILRINYLKESPTWMINHHSLKEATEYVRNNYDVDLKLEGTGSHFQRVNLQSLLALKYLNLNI